MKTRLSLRSTSSIFNFASELQATTLLAARGLMPFWRDAADAPLTAATLKPATAKAPVTPWAALPVLDVDAKKPGACAATATSLCTSTCRLWPGARKARPPREAAPSRPPARTLDERAIVRREGRWAVSGTCSNGSGADTASSKIFMVLMVVPLPFRHCGNVQDKQSNRPRRLQKP